MCVCVLVSVLMFVCVCVRVCVCICGPSMRMGSVVPLQLEIWYSLILFRVYSPAAMSVLTAAAGCKIAL